MTRYVLACSLLLIAVAGCDRFNAPAPLSSVSAPATPGASATVPAPLVRQYYGAWKKTAEGIFYRPYYYKPNATYAGFKHHLVVYRQDKPDYLYFFNPYTKTFWGRCSSHAAGEPLYSMLPEPERKRDLEEIREESFPPPASLPPIPESTDQVKIDLPPDDLEVAAGGEF